MGEQFSEESLQAQDGKKVPLRLEPGGPIIGEATLRYSSDTGELIADMQVDDPQVVEFLGRDVSSIIFRKES
jgi:hypothetical protein